MSETLSAVSLFSPQEGTADHDELCEDNGDKLLPDDDDNDEDDDGDSGGSSKQHNHV